MAVPQKDYPLYENLQRPWDESEARRRWKEYNTREDGSLDLETFHTGFMWYDSDDPESISKHKLPFVDVIDGEPYAIWRAIVAIRQRLGQTDIPEEDKRKVEARLRKYYKKAGKEYDGEKSETSSADISYTIYAADAAHLNFLGFEPSGVSLAKEGDVYYIILRGALSTSDYRRLSRIASSIPNGASVVLDIDSPGGEAYGIDMAEAAIRRLSKRANVVAYTSGMMTSAAYLIASPARKIYASETALVGSVGAISVLVSMKRALNNAGIDVKLVRSGDLKAANHPLGEITPTVVNYIQKRVNMFGKFIRDRVMENRNIPEEKMKEVERGSSYVAPEARELGLIDDVSPHVVIEKEVVTEKPNDMFVEFLVRLGVDKELAEKAATDEKVLDQLAEQLKAPQPRRDEIETRDELSEYEKLVLKQLGYEND